MNLEEIVNDYLNKFASKLSNQLSFFKEQPSLADCICQAALAQGPTGRLCHQRRVRREALEQSARALVSAENEIRSCCEFRQLYEIVNKLIGSIFGIGRNGLTVYDTALRIGSKLELEPKLVYLHVGTRKGAEVLGLNVKKRNTIESHELPAPLQLLRPIHIENLLCLYKDQFGNSFAEKNSSIHKCF